MASILLGCIADDFTGASDLANNLVRAGMRTVQTIGVPDGPLAADVDAVVGDPRFTVVDGPDWRFGARGDGWSVYVLDPDGNTVELRTYERTR